MKVCFEIFKLPKMPNELLGRHWRARAKHAIEWHSLVGRAIGANRPAQPAKVARLVLTRHSSSQPDFDGLAGSFKAILDALVKLYLIEDDNIAVIGQPDYRWVRAKPRQGKITVEIELGVSPD